LAHSFAPETKGYALAFVGVVVFALTLPVTRWMVSESVAQSLSPLFVTVCRCGLLRASVDSSIWALATRFGFSETVDRRVNHQVHWAPCWPSLFWDSG